MSDHNEKLEQELRQLTPLPPSIALDARITQSLSHSEFRILNSEFPPSNRLLKTTLTAAAASLLLIITLLTTDYLNTPTSSPTLVQSPNTLTPANTRLLLAQLTHDQSP